MVRNTVGIEMPERVAVAVISGLSVPESTVVMIGRNTSAKPVGNYKCLQVLINACNRREPRNPDANCKRLQLLIEG